MTSHAASPAPPATVSAAGMGWLILLPLGLLVLTQALLATAGVVDIAAGALADPDAYMRLNRVLLLEQGGAWFDSRFPRINPPEGHVQHWSRPLDLILLLGAKLVEPALGFERALHLAGTLMSPICLALAVVSLNWAVTPLLDREERFFACFVFLLQPMILAYSSLGRPDHHSLLLLLALVLLGLTIRCMQPGARGRVARLAGVVAALSLWISTEALVFVGASLLALGIAWLIEHARSSRHLRDYALAAAATLCAALLVERGLDGFFVVENDRLSIVHVVLFGVIGLFWQVVRGLPSSAGEHLPGRVLIAGLGAAGLGGIMIALFPELRAGPLGTVDPVYRELRLERIIEIQPLIPAAWLAEGAWVWILGRVCLLVGPAVLAVPAMIWLLRRGPGPVRRHWLPVASGLAVFLPLSFYQNRWSIYAEALLVVPYGVVMAALLHALGRQLAGIPLRLGRLLAVALGLFWPLGLALAYPPPTPAVAGDACPMAPLAAALQALSSAPRTIMTLADYGPELLYRTRHNVLSIPNHRPQPGFGATAAALGATDDATARTIMAAHRVDWLLLCGDAVERDLAGAAGAGSSSLYERLRTGEPPGWLRAIPLGAGRLRDVRLFERSGAPGGS